MVCLFLPGEINTNIAKAFYNDGTNMPMGFPGFMGRPPVGMSMRGFDEYYRCYPVAMLPGPERDNVNHGGRVILPPSALDKLTRLHITYPMLFELHNGKDEKMTHAGVVEFIAEEGKIYLPYWVRPPALDEDLTDSLVDANAITRTRRSSSNQIN